MKIELVYFEGCPNIDATRNNIKAALEKLGKEAKWDEWAHGDGNAPEYIMQYGSPTVLVCEKDVAGGPKDCCAPNSCRVYEEGGAPSVDAIIAMIEECNETTNGKCCG